MAPTVSSIGTSGSALHGYVRTTLFYSCFTATDLWRYQSSTWSVPSLFKEASSAFTAYSGVPSIVLGPETMPNLVARKISSRFPVRLNLQGFSQGHIARGPCTRKPTIVR